MFPQIFISETEATNSSHKHEPV